jgi:hypothetical protein
MKIGDKFVVTKEIIADWFGKQPPTIYGNPKTTGTIELRVGNAARVPVGSLAVYVGDEPDSVNSTLWDVTAPHRKRIREDDTKTYKKLRGVTLRRWNDCLTPVDEISPIV